MAEANPCNALLQLELSARLTSSRGTDTLLHYSDLQSQLEDVIKQDLQATV